MTFLAVVVFAVFLILKLVDVIDWSWWLITSPLLIWVGFTTLAYSFFGAVSYIIYKGKVRK